MTHRRAAGLLLLSALAGCASHHTETSALGCAHEAYEGQPLPEGRAVVACGLPPGVGLIAVDDGAVYTVTAAATFFASDVTTGMRERLFRDVRASPSTAHARALGTVVHEGALYFPSRVLREGYIAPALVAIAADRPTPDEAPRVVVEDHGYTPMAPFVARDGRLYAASVRRSGHSASSGPVIELRFDGGVPRPVTSEHGTPIGVVGDTLYYCHDAQIRRVATGGGESELVTDAPTSFGCFGRLAADEDYVYLTTAEAPYEIWRVGRGGAREHLYTAPVHPEIPLGPPNHLRRDGWWLYFLRGEGETGAELLRIRADGSGEAESLAQGPGLSPPVFDETGIYVAMQRGGFEAPIEAVVLRIARASLDHERD